MSDSPEDDDRTVYQPKIPPPAPPPAAAGGKRRKAGPAPAPAPPPPPPAPPAAAAVGGTTGSQQIANGEVLNGIYRITRFLARGGMGEVYEAQNVHQPDERVAVKVMLAHLAQDELVAAMFAKEAATLTRLHHEAIVQYRLAARDSLGRPYLVTEFIDGPSLEEKLGELKLTDAQFVAIAQKLAAGLGTAHTLGAIHRDIAPDNILLVGGDPGRPKIIDFGIAKDAREHSATIVGDGFAGKLRYVAPEQLGEYGRNIGPWSDIYSLALTLRALLAGGHSDMGGSLSDAVRKRMSVPDLSAIPAPFRAAFEAALQPDPARRPQTMVEFNLMLSQDAGAFGAESGSGFASTASGGSEATRLTLNTASPGALGDRLRSLLPAGLGQNRLPLIIGGATLGLLALVGIVIALSLGGGDQTEPPPLATAPEGDAGGGGTAAARLASGTPEFAALAERSATRIPCSWVNLAAADASVATFTGAAAVPGEAQARLAEALEAAGASVPALDFGNVMRFPQQACGVIEALRDARGTDLRITTPQRIYEANRETIALSDGSNLPEDNYAKVLIQVSGAKPGQNLILLAVTADDGVTPISRDPAETEIFVTTFKGDVAPDGFSVTYPYPVEKPEPTGLGFIVVASPNPLPGDMFTFDASWPERFRKGAQNQGWTADAMWFSVEDRQPG